LYDYEMITHTSVISLSCVKVTFILGISIIFYSWGKVRKCIFRDLVGTLIRVSGKQGNTAIMEVENTSVINCILISDMEPYKHLCIGII
jgi:hypothetical protein